MFASPSEIRARGFREDLGGRAAGIAKRLSQASSKFGSLTFLNLKDEEYKGDRVRKPLQNSRLKFSRILKRLTQGL